MSITEQRLNDYQLQMSIYAEQHNMLLVSDVLDMIEQLQDDLKDDVDKVVEQLEDRKSLMMETLKISEADIDRGRIYGMEKAIEIVKGGGVNGKKQS